MDPDREFPKYEYQKQDCGSGQIGGHWPKMQRDEVEKKMDPDREALKTEWDRMLDDFGHLFERCGLFEAMRKRDLARLEGEKPKRASLGELVAYLEKRSKDWGV